MVILGKRQTLTVAKKVPFGAYLKDTSSKVSKSGSSSNNDMSSDVNSTEEFPGEVLLPKKEVPSDLEVFDPIEVFVYRDSEDRLIATTRDPYIHLGETKELEVKDVTNFGAFLDWGLEKDLFLPFKEQKGRPQVGDKITVTLYVDKSGRLSATMWVPDEKKKQSIYENNANTLHNLLKKNHGFLPLTDKSSPEDIKKLTGMSKNEFKKSCGNLYKNKVITLENDGIYLK